MGEKRRVYLQQHFARPMDQQYLAVLAATLLIFVIPQALSLWWLVAFFVGLLVGIGGVVAGLVYLVSYGNSYVQKALAREKERKKRYPEPPILSKEVSERQLKFHYNNTGTPSN